MTSPGELRDRIYARLIDYLPLGAMFVVIGVMVTNATGLGEDGRVPLGVRASILGINLAIQLAYFSISESRRGTTFGKSVMKLRVVGPDGGNPTFVQALRRNLFLASQALTLVPFFTLATTLMFAAVVGVAALGIAQDEDERQGWHDHFGGGTRVVKERG